MKRPDIPFLTAVELAGFRGPYFRVDKDGDLTWRWLERRQDWPRRTLYLEFLVCDRRFKAADYLRTHKGVRLHWSYMLLDDGRCEALVEVLRASLSTDDVARCATASITSNRSDPNA